jgi:ring-1,2-phenylacetyl-CoA epoxidase subunit PaaE
MSRFHQLSVKEVRKETDDTVSVAFHVPVSDESQFQFIQGQYLTLRKEINGEDVRRSYSICSAVGDELRVAIKKVEGGLFSSYANDELKKDQLLDVMPPMGKFYVPVNPAKKRNYLLFAAGSGITPIMSILKTVLRDEPLSSVTLFYGNRRFSSIVFRDELEDIKDRYLGRFRLFHVLSQENADLPLFSGRINAEKCSLIFKSVMDLNSVDEFFICGPEPMIKEVSEYLKGAGVADEKVHFELFTSPKGDLWKERKESIIPAEDQSKISKVQVTIDGNSMQFDLAYGGKPILDAALAQGADLPFSCKGGVCRTCMAKLEKGTVKMEANYALEPGEVEQGLILTCQSHPTSEECVVNYDVSG